MPKAPERPPVGQGTAAGGAFAWLATATLAGSFLAMIEGLWQIPDQPATAPELNSLIIVWSAVTGSVLILVCACSGLIAAFIRHRLGMAHLALPAALLAIGVQAALQTEALLFADLRRAGGANTLLLELPAVALVSGGLCLLLLRRWPTVLDSLRSWLFLHGLLAGLGRFVCPRCSLAPQRFCSPSWQG